MPVIDYDQNFASLYDIMYADRDFDADARYAAQLLGLEGRDRCHVLDIGCGAGSHVLAFARLGIHATGIDTSEAMIAQAREKPVDDLLASVNFVSGRLPGYAEQLNGHRFDGAVSIFQVFNCMQDADEMLDHLRVLRHRLRPGGRFLIDLWNGAAVFTDAPRTQVRTYRIPDGPEHEVVRITTPEVDPIRQRCTLRYDFIDSGSGRDIRRFTSVHDLTFLTPAHYRQLFSLADLRVIDEFRRGAPGVPVSTKDWYISYLVQAPA